MLEYDDHGLHVRIYLFLPPALNPRVMAGLGYWRPRAVLLMIMDVDPLPVPLSIHMSTYFHMSIHMPIHYVDPSNCNHHEDVMMELKQP